MKYCEYCGIQLEDNDNFCFNCGAKCKKIVNNNNNCNYNYTGPNNQINSDDRSIFGYNLLSFAIPIIGILLYVSWKQEYPVKAKNCFKWAIIGLITSIVLNMFFPQY